MNLLPSTDTPRHPSGLAVDYAVHERAGADWGEWRVIDAATEEAVKHPFASMTEAENWAEGYVLTQRNRTEADYVTKPASLPAT